MNELARANSGRNTGVTAELIQSMSGEIARALPTHMNGDRMARLALTAIRQTPKLAGTDPRSFMGALLTSASLGLEPNTPAGEAYLIPYGKECQLVIGYQGLIKLFWQSPLAQHIDAQPVYENDEFDYGHGLDPYLRHRPADGERGSVTHYYAVAALNTGAKAFTVLTADEVKQLRQGKVGPSGNIGDPMRWMERKTALKQLLKTMPKSAELSTAVRADDVSVGSKLPSVSGVQVPQQIAAPVDVSGAELVDDAQEGDQ